MVGVDGSKLDLSLRGSRTGEPVEELQQTDTEEDKEEGGVSLEKRLCDPEVTSLEDLDICLLYTSPSPRDATLSRMPSSA